MVRVVAMVVAVTRARARAVGLVVVVMVAREMVRTMVRVVAVKVARGLRDCHFGCSHWGGERGRIDASRRPPCAVLLLTLSLLLPLMAAASNGLPPSLSCDGHVVLCLRLLLLPSDRHQCWQYRRMPSEVFLLRDLRCNAGCRRQDGGGSRG
jgi:hypothetical protein